MHYCNSMLKIIGLLLAMCSPVKAGQVDYFCLFTNAAAAQADGAVGAFWFSTNSVWDLSQTFPSVSVITAAALVNGINPNTGFWIVISQTARNAALDAKANCVMTLDRDLGAVNGAFVLAGTLTGANRTNATFSPIPAGSKYPRPFGK